MISLFIIILLIIIIIKLYNYKNNIEGFLLFDFNVDGHNPYIYPEYRIRKNIKLLNKDQIDINKLNSLKWETRFPSLVKHRYHYNDKIIDKYNIEKVYDKYNNPIFNPHQPINSLNGKARLIELPLYLKNRYQATISLDQAFSDYLNYGDIITEIKDGNKIRLLKSKKNNNIDTKKYIGSIYYVKEKPKYLKRIISVNNYNNNNKYNKYKNVGINKEHKHYIPSRIDNNPVLVDLTNFVPIYDIKKKRKIGGYNPTDIYPASYADRSKESIEKLAGINIYNNYLIPNRSNFNDYIYKELY